LRKEKGKHSEKIRKEAKRENPRREVRTILKRDELCSLGGRSCQIRKERTPLAEKAKQRGIKKRFKVSVILDAFLKKNIHFIFFVKKRNPLSLIPLP
jgi:hypothetical protein